MGVLKGAVRAFALCATGFVLGVTATSALAEESDLSGKVAIELNALQSAEAACTLTFLVINGHATEIDKLVYETVLFDATGQVDRLTLFDFGTLPPGRPRVRQFAVPDLACDQLGRVLFNGLHTCTGDGIDAETCAQGMVTSSRTGIEVLG